MIFLSTFFSQASAGQFLDVRFLNVGYGDSILIRSPDNSYAMIDAGDASASQRLREELSGSGVKEIGTAIITHPHENHYQGFQELVQSLPINQWFINREKEAPPEYTQWQQMLEKQGIEFFLLSKGDTVPALSEGIKIEVLHPSALGPDINDNSLVLWLTYGNTAFLFTSDIGEKYQEKLIADYPFIKKADCVQLPHHGGPLSERFINFFDHAVFIMSTGPNSFGIPGSADIQKLKGKKYFRTDRDGIIFLKSDGEIVGVISSQ